MKNNKNRVGKVISLILVTTLVMAGCGTTGGAAASVQTDSVQTDDMQTVDGQTANEQAAAGQTDGSATEANEAGSQGADEKSSTEEDGQSSADSPAPEIAGLTYESTMSLEFAEGFAIYAYADGYRLIDVHESAQYLVVPENMTAPEGLDASIVVLQQPVSQIYLAATSAMALFDAVDALDSIQFSGTAASGWYVPDAVTAMEAGNIVYAGKYSEPDYELLVNEGCQLAIESTMILHSPKVKEMLEDLDIPVFVDRSSYEKHPLGRTEWIKLYGVLTGKEAEAERYFETQSAIIDQMAGFENTEKTVAFFYINSDGTAVVRQTSDYIPKMIEIAGGRYVFDQLNGDTDSAAVSMTMEEFYDQAADADYLIYNGAIDGPIDSIDVLVAKSELFKDFKAVQAGNVWTVDKYLYQATDIVGQMITDVNLMLTNGDTSQMTFLKKVQ